MTVWLMMAMVLPKNEAPESRAVPRVVYRMKFDWQVMSEAICGKRQTVAQ
jgi:hypothetical protein